MRKSLLGTLAMASMVCLMAAGCGEQATTEKSQGLDLTKAAQTVQSDMEKAKQKAEEAATQAKREAEKAAEQARMETEQAEKKVQAQAQKVAEQTEQQVADQARMIKDILAQARELLDSGQLEAAIKRAQVVLDEYDSNSSVALNIINTAKHQLKRKIDAQAAGVQEGVQGVLGNTGQ